MEIKSVLTISAIAIAASITIILFINGAATGMISGQQKGPYSYVYGPHTHTNLCAFISCPNGATGMPVGIERYSGKVYCVCPKEPIPYYEMPAYVKVIPR